MLALLAAMPLSAHAAGTTAGTTISNSATLKYDNNLGVPQTDIIATPVTFVVDEKINLTVVGGAVTNVMAGATAQVSTFTVTNNANSPLDFNLAVNQVATGDQFDATACNAYLENGAHPGVYNPTEDTATFIDELAADASQTVYAVCDIPAARVNGDVALVGLTATARGNFTGAQGAYVASAGGMGAALAETAVGTPNVDMVFADNVGSESGDAARDAKHSARNTYSVGALVTLTKTVINIKDTYGCSAASGCKAIPGSILTYQIVMAITGAGSMDALVIADPIPANMTYVPGSIALDGVAKTDVASDGDKTDFGITTTNTVTYSPGTIAMPRTISLTFQATIN